MCHYLCRCYGVNLTPRSSQRFQTDASSQSVAYGCATGPFMPVSTSKPYHGDQKNRRVPLLNKDGEPVQTVPQAVAELKRLQTHRADNTLRTLERTPKFCTYAVRYLEFVSSGQGAKKPGTVEKEKAILSPCCFRTKSRHLDRAVEAIRKTRGAGIGQIEKVRRGDISVQVNPVGKICGRLENVSLSLLA